MPGAPKGGAAEAAEAGPSPGPSKAPGPPGPPGGSAPPPPGPEAEAKPERPLAEILKDAKAAVKELTGEDASNITEILEQLGLKNEGTLKEKVHAAATELGVSIFVWVGDFLQQTPLLSPSLIQPTPHSWQDRV